VHLEHYRRHGDPLKGSYKAAELAPFRKAAAAWVKEHRQDAFVTAALGGVEAAMLGAGKAIEPNQLRGLTTEAKAKAVWARMRERGRKPDEVLSAVLGVAMKYSADFQRAKPEHRTVQIGKVLNRMGGGRVKRWKVEHPDAVNGVPRCVGSRLLRGWCYESLVSQRSRLPSSSSMIVLQNSSSTAPRSAKKRR
jgi:hypothetical protein